MPKEAEKTRETLEGGAYCAVGLRGAGLRFWEAKEMQPRSTDTESPSRVDSMRVAGRRERLQSLTVSCSSRKLSDGHLALWNRRIVMMTNRIKGRDVDLVKR